MPRDTEAAFDKRAATYDSWHVRYADRLVELAAITSGTRVLDAATGTGFAALAAARATGPTGHVVGVDISGGMLARARESAAGVPNVALIQADAAFLPDFADGSFGLVLCSAGLLYLPVHNALREWRRLLAPGGRVGFSTMREGFPLAARLFRQHARRYGLDLTDPAAPLGTPARCALALADAGFVPEDIVEETVRFSSRDLDNAWEAHVHGVHHAAVGTLAPAQALAFQQDYTNAVGDALRADEDGMLDAEVIYAFGRVTRTLGG
jgi:ubiquinone/menaquinone biosynthesis C-methylase UbiE